MKPAERYMRVTPLLTILVFCGLVSANADTVTYSETQTASGFLYSFTVDNEGDTDGTINDLFLSVPTAIANVDTTSIRTPVGWGDPVGGLLFFGPDVNPGASFIEWSADFSGLYDVEIGQSLGGFAFVSSSQIAGVIEFALNGSLSQQPVVPLVSTPEPSGALLFLGVGIWFLGYLRPWHSGSVNAPVHTVRQCEK